MRGPFVAVPGCAEIASELAKIVGFDGALETPDEPTNPMPVAMSATFKIARISFPLLGLTTAL
jgi:hypothetical protein